MNTGDFDAFCEVVVGFAELKGKQLSAPALKIYFRAMRSWSLQDFQVAAEQLLRTCEFMPTPKDFEDLRRAGDLTAGEAWDNVLSGCELVPGSREERAARIAGGQYTIRHANIERDLPFIQRRFMDAYNELADVDAVRTALPQIAGSNQVHALRNTVVASLPPVREMKPRVQVVPVLPRPDRPQRDPRDRVRELVKLPGFTDEQVARITQQSVEFVREVRASVELPA